MSKRLVILPTAVAVEQFCVRGARERADRVVFGHGAISRGQLVRQAHAQLFPAERMLSDAESAALTARACIGYFETHAGAPFAGIADRPGFWRAVRRFLSECRAALLGPDELRRLLKLADIADARADAICGLYAAEEKLFDESGASDLARAESKLARELAGRFNEVSFLDECDDIEIRGLIDIKPALFDLILELARHRPVRLILPLPNEHPRTILWLVWTYRKFENLGEHHPSGLTLEAQALAEHSALAEVAERMFLPAAALRERGTKPLDAEKLPLKILPEATPQDESLETARRALERIQAGDAPESIAILFRNAAGADDCVHAFRRFGVDVELDPPDPFAPILALYELAENGFTRDDVAGFLARPPWPLDPILQHTGAAALFKEAKILKGDAAHWRRQLDALARDEDDERRAKRIRKLAAAIEKEIKDVNRIVRDATPAQAIQSLLRMLDRRRADPGELARARLSALERLWRGWSRPLPPLTLRHLIETVAGPDAPALDKRPAGVRLLSAHDLPEMEIDHLFITGMTAGSFPAEPVQEVLLKDHERLAVSRAFVESLPEDRRHLAAAHRPFDTSREERLRENFLFYLCATQARRSLTLSYGKQNADGQPQVASSYLDEIDKLFADRAPLRVRPPVTVQTRAEREQAAIRALARSAPVPPGADPARLRRIGERAHRERERDLFYLERDRGRRAAAATPYTGRLGDNAAVRIKTRLAVVALEDFAVCGFKGFASHLLGVREIETPVDGFSPREFGTFLHTVLEELWREMIIAKPDQLDARLALVDAAAGRLDAIIDKAAKPFEHKGAAGPLWNAQKRFITLALEQALRLERRDVEAGYWPAEVESKIELPLERAANPQSFSGRIDRIDVNTQTDTLRIVDYKTTGAATLKQMGRQLGETELQMAAYAQAAAKRFTCGEIELMYLSIKHGVEQVAVRRGPADEMTRLFDPAALLENIDRRRFDVTPVDPAECAHCPLRTACRIRPVLEKNDED